MRMSPELKRAVDRLSEHLIGTSREKTAAFKYCEQRKSSVSSGQTLTPDGISCLYWRWQLLLKDKQALEAKAVRAESGGKRVGAKKVKSKGKKTVSTVALNSVSELQRLSLLPYDDVLKKSTLNPSSRLCAERVSHRKIPQTAD